MRYVLKGCVRCGGDLCETWDVLEGLYAACLQCGHRPLRGAPSASSGTRRTASTASRAAPKTLSHRARPP